MHAPKLITTPMNTTQVDHALARTLGRGRPRLATPPLAMIGRSAIPVLGTRATETSQRVPTVPARLTVRTRPTGPLPALPVQRRFPVASVDFSRKDAALPFGTPRFVSATTLKRLAGGRRVDQLLRQVGHQWEFVDDHARIDLTDATQQFKLGRLTIFS